MGETGGLLMFLLSGGLVGIAVAGYRFYVNFRNTERGMARRRIQQANRNEHAARYEAGLWQARCADLEYLLRTNGIRIPALNQELRRFIEGIKVEEPDIVIDWKEIGEAPPSEGTGP